MRWTGKPHQNPSLKDHRLHVFLVSGDYVVTARRGARADYLAWDRDDPELAIGHGTTRLKAIADLALCTRRAMEG